MRHDAEAWIAAVDRLKWIVAGHEIATRGARRNPFNDLAKEGMVEGHKRAQMNDLSVTNGAHHHAIWGQDFRVFWQ